MSNKSREIRLIIEEMIENPSPQGIYPTSAAFDKLEKIIQGERVKFKSTATNDRGIVYLAIEPLLEAEVISTDIVDKAVTQINSHIDFIRTHGAVEAPTVQDTTIANGIIEDPTYADLRSYPNKVLDSVSQMVNTVFLFGTPDESVSGRAYRLRVSGQPVWALIELTIDSLFFWQNAHCETAFKRDLARSVARVGDRTIPPEDELPILCDKCNKEIKDYERDLYHHTGIVDGILNGHIHLCQSCTEDSYVIDLDNEKTT